MTWLEPTAWWGLAGLALPILIHLLAKASAQRFPFPSLRFVRATQMTALRRRVISDWALLMVRMLIVLAATAALAAPVFVSEARRAAWNQRVARAFVLPENAGDDAPLLVEQETRASFAAATFDAGVLADALREAVEWLRRQPPAAREIVIAGDLRESILTDRDLDSIPPFVGLRFLPVTGASEGPAIEWDAIAEVASGQPAKYRVQVTADERRTRARYEPTGDAPATTLRIATAPEDQEHAQALERAVLRQGVLIGSHSQRRVTIAFGGAPLPDLQRVTTPAAAWMRRALEQNPEVRGGEVDGTLVVRSDLRVTDERAAGIVSRLVQSAFAEPLDSLEPRRITAAVLARWARPPGPSPVEVLPGDEGDRRWFWAAALALIAMEHVLRRRRRPATDASRHEGQLLDPGKDARVA